MYKVKKHKERENIFSRINEATKTINALRLLFKALHSLCPGLIDNIESIVKHLIGLLFS